MDTLAVVQARCSSSRLPGKVLKQIKGKPMIMHELERLKRSTYIEKIIVATSIDSCDDSLAELLKGMGMDCFRGSLEDVLDRYYQCAIRYKPKNIVRITGDCPVIDWRITDMVIKKHLEHENDYTYLSEDFPDGLDTEVIEFSALASSWKNAKLMSEREHVTQYLRKHKEKFKVEEIPCKQPLGDMRWTVDEISDFIFINKIYEELYEKEIDFSMDDILKLLSEKPELLVINQGIMRNEGLNISIQNDKTI